MLRQFVSCRAAWLVALVIGLSLGLMFVAGAAASVGGRVPLDESSLVGSRGSNVNNVLTSSSCDRYNLFACVKEGDPCDTCSRRTFVDLGAGSNGGYKYGTTPGDCGTVTFGTCDANFDCTLVLNSTTNCSAPKQVTVQSIYPFPFIPFRDFRELQGK